MWGVILQFAFTILEKITLGWWKQRKIENVHESENKDAAMSDDDAVVQLSEHWTRK